MPSPLTLFLSRREVAELLDLGECIAAVEAAWKAHAEGQSAGPRLFGLSLPEGSLHAKGAGLHLAPTRDAPPAGAGAGMAAANAGGKWALDRPYAAVKINANFPHNPSRHGLPTIQGVVVLFDGERGTPLAVMDSAELTARRTAAATAVAARHLARPESSVALIVGCGVQARAQLRALAKVLPLRLAYAYDLDPGRARELALELAPELGFPVEPAADLEAALHRADACVTCTPSRGVLVRREAVAPGTFIAAVGADSEDKQELAPELMAAAKVVPDALEQAAAIGDLHWALDSGLMSREDVHAELPEIVAGYRPGRSSPSEITIFDSTGTALQDLAAAVVVFARAHARGLGLPIDLAG